MIPALMFRTVPADTSAEVESFWSRFGEQNPTWEQVTYRDPIDPADFPLTSPAWSMCGSGAQYAGLIRLEALLDHGGVYLDSDCEPFRPLDPLRSCSAFAGWEDANTVPDAVLGAEPNHPAIAECLERALESVRQGEGAWRSGPGVTTTVLPDRPDVLLLPPGSLYPYHYAERRRRHDDHRTANPWAFMAHHWAHSWA